MKTAVATVLVVAGALAGAGAADNRPVNGTIWAANRGTHTIRGFDASTGRLVRTIDMSSMRFETSVIGGWMPKNRAPSYVMIGRPAGSVVKEK